LAAVLVADVKVTETAEVAEGDATAGVEPVAANAVIDLRLGQRRRGFESGIESLQRRAAVQCTMRSLLVIDGAESVELMAAWPSSQSSTASASSAFTPPPITPRPAIAGKQLIGARRGDCSSAAPSRVTIWRILKRETAALSLSVAGV
jgi:hypothetical protein